MESDSTRSIFLVLLRFPYLCCDRCFIILLQMCFRFVLITVFALTLQTENRESPRGRDKRQKERPAGSGREKVGCGGCFGAIDDAISPRVRPSHLWVWGNQLGRGGQASPEQEGPSGRDLCVCGTFQHHNVSPVLDTGGGGCPGGVTLALEPMTGPPMTGPGRPPRLPRERG